MLGRLFASEKDAASTVFPSANAMAHVRMNPVTRDTSVSPDIMAVERAIDFVVSAFFMVVMVAQNGVSRHDETHWTGTSVSLA